MKKIGKELLLFFILLLLLIIIRFPLAELVQSQLDSQKQALKSQGIIIENGKIEDSFPAGVKISRLGVLAAYKPAPIPLVLQNLVVKVNLARLFLLGLGIQGSGEAYSGKLNGILKKQFYSDKITALLNGKEIDLGEHPLLQLAGIQGICTFALDARLAGVRENNRDNIEHAELRVNLEKGAFAGGYKAYGLFALPKIEDLNIEAKAEKIGRKIELKELHSQSSLGSAEANGAVELSAGSKPLAKINLTIKLNLTAYGVASFGDLLALQANMTPGTSRRDWLLTIEKNEQDQWPRLSVRAGGAPAA